MTWSPQLKEMALVACSRHCCICHAFCGTKIELHHIKPQAKGGTSTLDNCIPLCFNCHADVEHYNPSHPKGTKYTESELRSHRDKWFRMMGSLSEAERSNESSSVEQDEIYDEQTISLVGYVWRQSFPGRPNYESFEHDEIETYWMLVLPKPITLHLNSWEVGELPMQITVKRLQLVLNERQYSQNRHFIMKDAKITGVICRAYTAHHRGDALLRVIEFSALDSSNLQ